MENTEDTRFRLTVRLCEDTVKKCEAGMKLDNASSRNDFIEKAICFYSGFLAVKTHTDFFAPVIAETIEGVMETTENRLAKLLFKIAVELAKLEQMLASINDMDDETLRLLHIKCVNEVKKINGILKFEEAVKEQRTE